MTNQTARQRILVYLQQHRGASAAEISRALRVTTANIRRHLSILASDGRVEVLGLREGDGPGRPVQIFGVAEVRANEPMEFLAGALLTQITEGAAAEMKDQIMQALAGRLQPERAGRPAERSANITHRLAASIEQLNRMGYQARWEAHAAAPRINFEHCPYQNLVAAHPELCRMDAFLLAGHLGREVELIAKLEKNTRGTLFCQFVLHSGTGR